MGALYHMLKLDSRKGLITTGILVFVVMMSIGALLGGQLNNLFFESVQTKAIRGKAINILFMGIDARDAKSNSRSDTLILASIDSETNKIAMVSIPRDTRIKNAAGKYDKINSVNFLEGPEAACKTVGQLLNVPVDYYVVTNFAGFGDIVDALGGVHIDVATNMRHVDTVDPELTINLTKGYQYLDGKEALAFVRYRGGPTADIGRTENQQKFIKALAAEMLQSKTILKLPQLIPELYKNVHTNLPIKDMIYLANMADDLDMSNINAQTLPGYFYHDNSTGASYWEADKEIASTLVQALLQGQTFKVVGETPASLRTTPTTTTSNTTVKPTVAVPDTSTKLSEPVTDESESAADKPSGTTPTGTKDGADDSTTDKASDVDSTTTNTTTTKPKSSQD